MFFVVVVVAVVVVVVVILIPERKLTFLKPCFDQTT